MGALRAEKSADDCISKRAYVKVHLLIQRQILGITNPIDSLALASEDWARDSAKDTNTPSGYMGKKALLDGVFEIADLWTEEYDRKEYEEFLLNLYNPIRKKVKRKERSKASPDSPPLVTAEVRARNMAPLAPSQINARNTTLRLDAVGTSGKRGSEAYTSAAATARPKKPSKIAPQKVGPRSGAAHVPRFGSSYTLHAPHSEAQTMVVCGSSQQGPGAASLVKHDGGAHKDKISGGRNRKYGSRDAPSAAKRSLDNLVREFQMKMNPRGERNAPYIDKGEMQILSRIDAAFAETPSAGHPEGKKLNDINAARNTFSAVISEIPKCASILQSIKREYDRWVLPPDEPESENCGHHPKVRRNAKKMAEDVRQATVSAASPPSMIPPREISTQVRLDKTKTKSHSYENTKRTFADDKKAQRLQAKPEVPYSRKDVLELEHWVEKRLGEMPDDVIDIDGAVSVLSACNAQIIKAVEYVDPLVASNTSMAWASMYDMMRIAKQDIESQRERQKLGTGLWTEEENDLRDQMRSAVQQKENAQKMVDDAKNEINEMKVD